MAQGQKGRPFTLKLAVQSSVLCDCGRIRLLVVVFSWPN